MRKRSFTPRCNGFTLLEVLIAISLMLALLGSMFTFTFNMLSTRARALEYSQKQLAATTLIERIESDLMTCLVGDRRTGAGVKGDESSLQILSRAVAASIALNGTSDPAVLGDLQQSLYRFSKQTGMIEASRGPVTGSNLPSKQYQPVGGSVFKVRFRFHDGNAWLDSFDSNSTGKLPVAVEIAVWFRPWPGEEMPSEEDDFIEDDRLTFDEIYKFDESEYAEISDLDLLSEPKPDRIRVIFIPDAGVDEDSGSAAS